MKIGRRCALAGIMFEVKCFVFIILTSFVLAEDGPLVETRNGLVGGTYQISTNGRKFSSFEGIPYAKPPTQKRRFKSPLPADPWFGVLIADTPYVCIQGILSGDGLHEDCLYINVYVPLEKPDPNEELDVVVHIHGGAFMMGSGHLYSGPKHLMDRDVVLVTFNYRLGIFGFLSTGDRTIPGNFGLKDQVAALQWVKDNIKMFGGNPDSVTITGLSAGGASVHLHYFSLMSNDVFNRGFAQSGSALNPWAIQRNPFENAKKLAIAVGCYNPNVKLVLSCLWQRSALQIAESVKIFYSMPLMPLAPFGPVVELISESTFMNVHPYMQLLTKQVLDKPLIMSMTADEGLLPSGILYNKLDMVEENWNKLAPLMLEYYDMEEQDRKDEISMKIKEHYFNDQPITKDNFNQFTKLCTHRLFMAGAEKSLRMQAAIANSSIYFMMMGYGGEESMLKQYFGVQENLGVSHGDDIKFYFQADDMKLTEKEEQMKDVLLDMLVSYAKASVPTISDVEWKPVDDGENLMYLSVMGPGDISMKRSKKLSPFNFWNSLGLKEEENAFVLRDGYVEIL